MQFPFLVRLCSFTNSYFLVIHIYDDDFVF